MGFNDQNALHEKIGLNRHVATVLLDMNPTIGTKSFAPPDLLLSRRIRARLSTNTSNHRNDVINDLGTKKFFY